MKGKNGKYKLKVKKLFKKVGIQNKKSCPCTKNQLLVIIITLSLLGLFIVIFIPVYITKSKEKSNNSTSICENDKNIKNEQDETNIQNEQNEQYKTNIQNEQNEQEKTNIQNEHNEQDKTNIQNDHNEQEKTNIQNEHNEQYEYEQIEEFDIFAEYYYPLINYRLKLFIPQKGYDNIYIHLGGISEVPGYFSNFFTSNKTFIPKGTKIYYISGKLRQTQYMYNLPVPSWFNVDREGNLICEDCSDQFDQAKESLNYILDAIDQIKNEENIDYNKIYLGGFSQGAIMVNYVLLNSRHKLGGYLAFSGYVFDHHFPPNTVLTELNNEQKQILESKKDYHILATHSFNDDSVFYPKIIKGYYTYYKDYSDFTLLSFGKLGHEFDTQPIHPYVRKWLKESMGK